MQDAGSIRIDIDLADGIVCAAAVRARRPLNLTRLFEGRAAEEAPALAARLFTLCAQAQGAAAAAAVGAAVDPRTRRKLAVAVLAERLFESLRALLMGWPGDPAFLRAAGPALREAAAAAQALARGPSREAFLALRAAAETLGFGVDEPKRESALGHLLRQCEKAEGLALTPPDALGPADDAEVMRALEDDPEGFAAAPELPGRRPETGAFARVWPELPEGLQALAARMRARLLDARKALAELEALIVVNAPPAPGAIEEGDGWGAVESPRGRLYHWARIDRAGRIAAYAILAPTEWNFHPNGPLIANLVGARLGGPEAARNAAVKLATLIDPCVGFEVAVREAA